MKHKFIIFIPLLLLVFPNISHSEFYKYQDPKTGATRYTDNLSEVPPDQREGIDAYEAVEDYQRPAPQPTPEQKETAPAEEENKQEEAKHQMSAAEKQERYKELTQEKDALDAEYAEIMEAKKTLDTVKGDVKRASELREYNEKVLELNTRIEAYDQKRKAYEEKIKSFNEAK